MRTEKQKMLAGERYDASDPELTADRQRARALCRAFNAAPPGEPGRHSALLAELFGYATDARIEPPFHCDYGYNIALGANAYFNVGCVVLDVAAIAIGANALFGPGVHIYAASHPMSAAERRQGLEFGAPVSIGDDVWVGGGAIICPGASVGAGAIIGAGSVVTRAIPASVFAAGNPCRVLRSL
jgi:maltose O-acetyltransferase